MSSKLIRLVSMSLVAFSGVTLLSGCEIRTVRSTYSSYDWGHSYERRVVRPIYTGDRNTGYPRPGYPNPGYPGHNPSYPPYGSGYPYPGSNPIRPIRPQPIGPRYSPVSFASAEVTSEVLNANAAVTTTIGNDLDKATPEAIAEVHSMTVASAAALKSAMEVSLSGDRSRLIALGFDDSEVEEFMVRSDASGASADSYAKVAGKLNMPSEELKAFVSDILGVVTDSKWEIYSREYPNE